MQLMLAISRLTGRQPPVQVVPRRLSGEVILDRIAREFDRSSRGPIIDGIAPGIRIAALVNDAKDPRSSVREMAKRELVRMAEAYLSSGKGVPPLVERTLRDFGITLL